MFVWYIGSIIRYIREEWVDRRVICATEMNKKDSGPYRE